MLGAAIGAGISGLFGMFGASKQNKAQIQSAREQMAFQERMSNTAHQREVTDLQAAGLNPILSAKLGGASSPGGAQANIVNEMAPLSNAAASMADKAYNYKVQTAQVDNMKLQNDLLKQQIEAAQIANARSGMFTPGYEAAGGIVDKIAAGANRLINSPDIVQEVLDMASGSEGISNAPSSAKSLDEQIPPGYRLAEKLRPYTKNSEAAKYYRGEKGFWESFKDAQRAAVEENRRRAKDKTDDYWRQKYELTPERLRDYGIKNLDAIRRRAGR